LGRGHARSLVDYLVHHPDDFRGAVARLRPELQGLYLAAYQAFLWDRMLAAALRSRIPPGQLLTLVLKVGEFPAPRQLAENDAQFFEALRLPLPSARLRPEPDADWLPWLAEALAGQGFALAEMKLP